MAEPRTLMTDLQFVESPRWHDGRLWFCDWGTRRVIALAPDGAAEVVIPEAPEGPFCIDPAPDGRLLVVAGHDGLLLRLEADGSLATHADLTGLSRHPWNEVVVDGRGTAYVNNIGFDFGGDEVAPGTIAAVAPDGAARQVAGGVEFPNGMALTPDGATLIVAESYANRLTAFDVAPDGGLTGRRVWADLGDEVPDGICLDAEGAVWYADVPNARCARVREGGEALGRIDLDRGCFSCALGGADGRTLFMLAAEWPGCMEAGSRTGRVLIAEAPAPAAGRP